ncbi:CHASE2 domain-containing protein [Mariprofundus sp. KV]|uniref:CHASE2 domain-containing protein n=1 Tax=Mariprofundus sp. KV TaxID=2608715 RepID=UPI0015A27A90|nr:CHASE2 domain-containing protein [Mariprofundus sp. KV]
MKKWIGGLIACSTVLLIIPLLSGRFTLVDNMVEDSRIWMSDVVIAACKDDPLGGGKDLKLSILSVDDSLHQSWGEPYITPRQKIAEMIRFAAEYHAAAVVVDFDLSRSEAWGTRTEGDKGLKRYLEQLDQAPAEQMPAIILLHDLRQAADGGKTASSYLRSDSSLADNRGNIFWASSTFPQEDDQLIRRFNYFEQVNWDKQRNIPSAMLLATEMAKHMQHGLSLAKSKQEIRNLIHSMQSESLPMDNQAMPIMLHENHASGIEVKPYFQLTDKKLSPRYYEGHIVLIGSMHSLTMDKHQTAIGDKFGVELMAHAIATMVQHGELKPLEGWPVIAYTLVLLVVMSLILLLPGIVSILIVSATCALLIFFPLSIYLYHHGLTLDAAPPILLIEIAEPIIPFILMFVLNVSLIREKLQEAVEHMKFEWSGREKESDQ